MGLYPGGDLKPGRLKSGILRYVVKSSLQVVENPGTIIAFRKFKCIRSPCSHNPFGLHCNSGKSFLSLFLVNIKHVREQMT